VLGALMLSAANLCLPGSESGRRRSADTSSLLGGVVVRMSDLRLAVVGSNPGHGIAGFSEVGDRAFRVNYLGM